MAQDSAYTSTRQIPATFKKFEREFTFSTNLDYGGGKYDDATNHLRSLHCRNWVYDPFNRCKWHNDSVLDEVIENGVDSITCLNVLNVIKDESERIAVLSHILGLAKDSFLKCEDYPTIYIQVYAGNGSGEPSKTTSQLNRKPPQYMDELRHIFIEDKWEINRKGNIFIIRYIW